MKCNKTYLIPDFIQKKLPPDEADIFMKHINMCKICIDEYRKLNVVFNELANEKVSEPNEIYWINLLPNIHNRINSNNVIFYKKYITQIILSIIIIIIASLTFFELYNYHKYNGSIQANEEILALIDSAEQNEILDYDENIISDNSDSFVLKNIILTSNNIEELYKENVSILELKDEEVNYLLSYLNETKTYKR